MKHALPLALLFVAIAEASASDRSLSQMYPGPWRTDFNIDITKTLAKNDVRVCGQYKYRPAASASAEYLVHCTRDGKNWTAWIVWTAIEEVEGPLRPDRSML